MEQKPSYNLHNDPRFTRYPDRGCMIHKVFKGSIQPKFMECYKILVKHL